MTDYADITVDLDLLRTGLIEADSSFGAAPEAPLADPEDFKATMRALAAGVAMVTARRRGRLFGLTISSCCSISASPPQLLISLAQTASCLPAVLETGRFGLSILRADQRPLAELGAVPGGPKEVDAFAESRDGLVTLIAGALAHLDCAVGRTLEVADHTLIIGSVERAIVMPSAGPEEPGPLLYFNRVFHALGSPIA